MTRAERLAQTEAHARAKLDADRTRLKQVQAQQRDAERQAVHRRRVLVGKLVDEAGCSASMMRRSRGSLPGSLPWSMPLIRSPFWRACSAPVPALPVRLCLATPRLRLVWPLRCQ